MWSPLTWFLILSALLEAAVCDILVSNVISTNTTRLHVVFVYTIAISKCHLGLPEYITVALEQAVEQEPDCDIVLLSNYAECPQISVLADKVNHLIKIDINDTMSVKTERYMKLSREIFLLDNPLWLASALRFFYLEDFMTKYACRELIHIEADNMIYGRMTGLVDALRKDYVGIAATPLTSRKTFITASIFWVANLKSLCDFNNYLLDLGAGDGDQWSNYLLYMKKRGYADKRKNVIRNSKLGGVGPGSINEMSMLGFYKESFPSKLFYFPVLPIFEYDTSSKDKVDLSRFQPGGLEVGAVTGEGIFDSGSWGQFLGGTHSTDGKDIGFTDDSHIVGRGIVENPSCVAAMMCSNISMPLRRLQSDMAHSRRNVLTSPRSSGGCYTAPFVRCNVSSPWTPLWNLHIHSKHTERFRSTSCECQQ